MKTSILITSFLAALGAGAASAATAATAGSTILSKVDTTGIPQAVYWELKGDLDWSYETTCTKNAFVKRAREVLYEYDSPSELTWAEKRDVRREVWDYNYQHTC